MNSSDEFTRFKENIGYSVIIPGAYGDGESGRESDQCRNIIMLSILLTVVVAICSILVRIFIQLFAHVKCNFFTKRSKYPIKI